MTMTKIDYEYYNWLVSQVEIPRGKSYNDLFERMHDLEFVWTVPNDDNRIQDGIDLRYEFLDGSLNRLNTRDRGVSILEILIALSRRTAFVADGNPRKWAWKLIKNLGLNKATDPLIGEKANRVEEVLYSLVWRTYHPNGQGGFFPLRSPREDQTKVEIWFQMQAYVNEIKSI